MSTAAISVALPATLKHPQVMPWLESLNLTPGQALQIDVSALHSFDSSALACLLEVRRRAQALQAPISLVGVPDRVRGLAKVYGVIDLI